MSNPTKRWLRWTAWALLAACVLGATEWALRRGGYEYTRLADRILDMRGDARTRIASSMYRFDAHELWSPRPGALLPWTNGERINPDGYRGPQLDVERTKGTLRIAFLGGAATLGVGVRWEDTYPALTARFLSERTMPAECLDGGVEDFSVRQVLERYRDLVRPYRPHVVVVSVPQMMSCKQGVEGWTDDQRIRRARALELDPHAAGNQWPCSRLLQFAHWMKDTLDGRYWSERDWEFQQLRLAPTVGDLDWPGARRVPIDDYYQSLSWLLQETRQDGAHLVLLQIPSAPGVFVPPVADVYQRTLEEFADREKLILLDGRNAYLAAVRDDIPKEDLFQSDQYPSECGHLQLAQAVTDMIVEGIAKKAAVGPGGKPAK